MADDVVAAALGHTGQKTVVPPCGSLAAKASTLTARFVRLIAAATAAPAARTTTTPPPPPSNLANLSAPHFIEALARRLAGTLNHLRRLCAVPQPLLFPGLFNPTATTAAHAFARFDGDGGATGFSASDRLVWVATSPGLARAIVSLLILPLARCDGGGGGERLACSLAAMLACLTRTATAQNVLGQAGIVRPLVAWLGALGAAAVVEAEAAKKSKESTVPGLSTTREAESETWLRALSGACEAMANLAATHGPRPACRSSGRRGKKRAGGRELCTEKPHPQGRHCLLLFHTHLTHTPRVHSTRGPSTHLVAYHGKATSP